jgi:hypothetical protein
VCDAVTPTAFSGKSEGKEHLTNAVMGLIFLIGGYLIFLQINPNILNIDFSSASGRVNIYSKEIRLYGDFGDPDESDNCEKYNTAYKKRGLNAQKCSSNEEFDGIFSFLEALGASIPIDTLRELRES